MKKFIIPMFALLLLATVTSCKSTKKMFAIQPTQTTIVVEQAEDIVAPAIEGKKSASYFSVDKTKCLPMDFDVTKTIADLKVSPNKIEYSCSYKGNDDPESRKAAVSYAIAQALRINGNADVLVEPKHEVKTENGEIVSVRVTGYAAVYCNFRTATQEDLKMLKDGNTNVQVVPQEQAEAK